MLERLALTVSVLLLVVMLSCILAEEEAGYG